MNKKTLKIVIIGGVILLLIGIAIILLTNKKEPLLKEELIESNLYLTDKGEYDISLNVEIESGKSPLYICNSNTIPSYLDSLASQIDNALQRTEEDPFIKWEKDDENVMTYDIDSTFLTIDLSKYPEVLRFSSIQDFISTYLDSSIEYTDPVIEKGDGFNMYMVNRIVDGKELHTGFGYSDYFLVENGYLRTAKVLLAPIEKSKYIVPMVDDSKLLESYLSNPQYPKNIVVDTTSVVTIEDFDYEMFDIQFEYENCVTNNLEPILLFSNCNQNYIYYSYEISGVCDIEYEKQLFSVPFKGFINAIEPEYVKNIE